MARPVNANAGATRARILAAASGLFADRGPGQTSVRAIAQKAKVSLAMINHYYGSKDELYQACVESMYEELGGLRSSFQTLMPIDSDANRSRLELEKSFIEALVRSGWQFALEHRSALRLVMRDVIDQGAVPLERQTAFLVPFLDQAGSIFANETDRPVPLVRSSLQGLLFMLVRYALCSDEEMMNVTQTETVQQARSALETHLVQISQNLLISNLENPSAHA